MHLELFTAPDCPYCASAHERLAEALATWSVEGVEVTHRDVLQHIDRAVDLGICRTPALVLDGNLIQQGGLDLDALHRRIREASTCA